MSSSPELDEDREFLLASLRDLEREHAAGDIDEADYLALRDDYTVRAAAVLRAMQGETLTAASATRSATIVVDRTGRRRPSGPGALGARRETRRPLRVLITGGVVGIAVVAGLLVASLSGERLAGQQATGSLPAGATGSGSGAGGGAAGGSVVSLLSQAQQLDQQGRVLDALKAYDAVLKVDPKNVVALTYKGWLLRRFAVQSGHPEFLDRAQLALDQALSIEPSFPDAHLFRGILLFQDRHDARAAIPDLQLYMAATLPENRVPGVDQILSEAVSAAGAAAGGSSPGGSSPTSTHP